MTRDDICWLAGLLEGEGCFTWAGKYSPQVQLQMTDRDVVERAAALMGAKSVKPRGTIGNRKPVWRALVTGERAEHLMRLVLPFMGERRSGRISSLLSMIESRAGIAKGERHHNAKLRPQSVLLVRELYGRGITQRKLAEVCGVNQPAIHNIVTGKTWKHLESAPEEALALGLA